MLPPNNSYADINDIRLVNLGVIGLFSNYKLTTSSGKHLEDISHAHIVSFINKLITSARDDLSITTDDLSTGIDRDCGRRQGGLSNNKTQNCQFHLMIMLKDIFGFAEHQEKGTFGLGYNSTLTEKIDNAVLNNVDAMNNAKIKNNAIEWYVPHYTPSISNQAILSKQILSNTPTELQYAERSVIMKEINTQNFLTFELGTQEGNNIP